MKIFIVPLVFLWPGFKGVFRYGLFSHLMIALVFGGVLQGTVALNFLWCDFLSKVVRLILCSVFFLSWIFLNILASFCFKKYERMRNLVLRGEDFLDAQTHYLRGDWFETECCLKAILKKNPYDVDSLLFLATLFRHTKRFAEAKLVLNDLEKIDASYRWRYEITLERNSLKKSTESLNKKMG